MSLVTQSGWPRRSFLQTWLRANWQTPNISSGLFLLFVDGARQPISCSDVIGYEYFWFGSIPSVCDASPSACRLCVTSRFAASRLSTPRYWSWTSGRP